ncbi:FRG domain-containing protein [Streptococcus equinus]|uniref:FRG domain-containing protein n=1 Tax=Streptococcus equinus TaxID=1335 RepID=A0A1H0QI27_STREI|nr:FRG domain-containing protein [Streptococcus equinus]SDP16860.1 FRG domain-containing protein [Streptococcus equinus]
MEKYEISSLIDFMTILKKISSSSESFFFRGESEKYKTPLLASGYRKNKFPELLKEAKKEYFREVGYSLDSDSRENFIAYCQHHGLPTELIDVTENPLVALYFACESNRDSDGIVYVIKNDTHISDPLTSKLFDKEVDIISIKEEFDIASLSFQQSGGSYIKFQNTQFYNSMYEDFFSLLILEDINDNYSHLNSKLKLCKYILKAHRKGVLETIIHHRSNILKNKDNIYELMELLDKYSEKTEIDELEKFYSEFKSLKFTKEVKIYPDKNEKDPRYDLMSELRDNTPLILLFIMAYEIRDEKFPPFPKIIYKPSITFDRLKNQQALFIYQMSTDKYSILNPSDGDSGLNVAKEVIQQIDFDYEIIIKSKNQILNELDSIGINRKFIYPDSDNIAKYIKEKYRI